MAGEYAPGWDQWGSPAWQKFQADLLNSGAMAANPTVLSGPLTVENPANPNHVAANLQPRPAPQGNALNNLGGAPVAGMPGYGGVYSAGNANSLQHGLSMYGGRRTDRLF